ncbi:MAG: TetR/AcrR family transcriptional regulator [Inconstantimicrobium porci]|uniref:TetR/AcrR family transcriptional regulator n=1 Tax=Inconstantimicrobium porci TaxID=2652291 RepID=A0A7X2MZS0_9CLOT|nr:TetR/AcrR family transcriptional regulator [Inconstantimicrobium porci]MDD6771477.1 TetR/AcrR family transcriptional regulator [Inconstantimicrobium porci]MDY5911698.1 TetR/AcrR family transcriptional regulator [Inconstantimicrobium porci]MSR92082.1 TetR/AcrR family transcriptional regulator [Inconstantimicrobium porci]
MPRAYNDKEREIIVNDLRKAALDCLKQYGVRKTTVDELVKRANIPKGTFYLFYQSKEMLLYDAINVLHDDIQSQLMAELEKTVTDEFGVDDLTDIIYYYFKITDESNIISILEHGDLELILRKIPVKEVTKHFEKDKISLDKLVELIPAIRNKDLSVYECALRSIFLSMLHKREVGEEHFDECIRLLIRGIVIQIMN